MNSNLQEIMEYMKEHYSNVYNICSRSGELDWNQTFKRIDSEIKHSKSFHGGTDMSGLSSLLSTIKLERIALGLVDSSSVMLYPSQHEKLDAMKAGGIKRNDFLCDYVRARMQTPKE